MHCMNLRWCNGSKRVPGIQKTGCSNPNIDRFKELRQGSDSFIDNRSAAGVNVMRPWG